MLGNEGFTEGFTLHLALQGREREHGAKDTGCREARSVHAWRMAGA